MQLIVSGKKTDVLFICYFKICFFPKQNMKALFFQLLLYLKEINKCG